MAASQTTATVIDFAKAARRIEKARKAAAPRRPRASERKFYARREQVRQKAHAAL